MIKVLNIYIGELKYSYCYQLLCQVFCWAIRIGVGLRPMCPDLEDNQDTYPIREENDNILFC